MTKNEPQIIKTTQEKTPKPSESLEESLRLIEDLKFFLSTAPANWQENQIIRRYYLNHNDGFISCIFWKNIYYITGTDIVRGVAYKFKHFGRQIIDQKKFEEGIFSDLRTLKRGTDAVLEESRSPFLKFLHKNQCLKTQKKQKVFYWFSVPHDKLFCDALERDLKKELDGKDTTTSKLCHEPALSFEFDPTKSLSEQLSSHFEKNKLNSDIPYPVTSIKEELDNDNGEDDFFSESQDQNEIAAVGDDLDAISPQEVTIEPQCIMNWKSDQDNQFDDFPLDFFQIADALTEESNMFDYSAITQQDLSLEPSFIDRAEKYLRSAGLQKSPLKQLQQPFLGTLLPSQYYGQDPEEYNNLIVGQNPHLDPFLCYPGITLFPQISSRSQYYYNNFTPSPVEREPLNGFPTSQAAMPPLSLIIRQQSALSHMGKYVISKKSKTPRPGSAAIKKVLDSEKENALSKKGYIKLELE